VRACAFGASSTTRVQELDAEAFEKWEGTSAYFNGDSVTVTLGFFRPFPTGFASVVGIDAGSRRWRASIPSAAPPTTACPRSKRASDAS
jgi:hypothetical protein